MITVRTLLLIPLAALAALIPLRAFALSGEDSPAFEVSASLGGCGVDGERVLCRIEASFSGAPGAEYYTATVTRADGGVDDYGTVGSGEGGGSTSLWVQYVGTGTYHVEITAWGSPPDEESGEAQARTKPKALATAEAEPGGDSTTGERLAPGEGRDPGKESPGEENEEEPGSTTEPPATLPECQPEGPQASATPEGEADPAAAEHRSEATAVVEEASGMEAAPLLDCPERAQDRPGPCCPPGG